MDGKTISSEVICQEKLNSMSTPAGLAAASLAPMVPGLPHLAHELLQLPKSPMQPQRSAVEGSNLVL